ncbi:hypothetical protein [Thalassospira sp.]|uniref:hypothetical protein n=1 Tax=Thalassospira sp. TaxID=1912094 RepID=UPI0027339A91|nr:hypothetical protein [Thalassospira sp.]MDP2699718.1 hypothetical protein [Thalassospira sp.]
MGHENATTDNIRILAGLTWHQTGVDQWSTSDRFAEYTIFRDDNDRWNGFWHREGIRIDTDWSCPNMETFAEYIVDTARHAAHHRG